MATVTGTFIDTRYGRANVELKFDYLSTPAVVSGMGFWSEETRTVTTDNSGYFEIVLPGGSWRMTAGTSVFFTILVPDTTNSYDFVSLITSTVYSPSAPAGSGVVSATDTIAGIVKMDSATVNPIAVSGVFYLADATALKAKSNLGSNKLAFLTDPLPGEWKIYMWRGSSSQVADDQQYLLPSDTTHPAPGRWEGFLP